MRKSFYSMLAMATMLFATTSCSQDEELVSGGSSGKEKVSFQIEMDGTGPSSRALGDGTGADKLYYEVWDMNTNQLVHDKSVNVVPLDGDKRGAQLSFDLVKGVPYDILFWAHDEANSVFDASDLKAVKMKTTDLMANKEAYDAFTAVLNNYKVQSGSKTIVPLKRPFSQVNVGTTKADWEKAEDLQVVIDKSLMTVKQVNTVYNVANGTASEPKDITYKKDALVDKSNTFTVTKSGVETVYYYLGMNYMLADADRSMKDMEIELHDGEHLINTIKVANMPIQRNYRTNVIGNLLTSNEGFEVVIDPNFTDTHVVELWDGSIRKPVTNPADASEYWIYSPEELAWVAAVVNGEVDSRSAVETFEGKTILLKNDIDLNNFGWSPIGRDESHPFKGTFNGNNITIYNLNVSIEKNADRPAGLIGYLGVGGSVKDLTIDGAKINGHANLAAVVGIANGHVTNCTVKNAGITATPIETGSRAVGYEKGNNVGAVVGMLCAGSYNVTDNNVQNVTLSGYGQVGGIVGSVHAGTGDSQTINNNTVSGLTIITDQNYENYQIDEQYQNTDTEVGSYVGSIVGDESAVKVQEETENDDTTISQGLSDNTIPEEIKAEGGVYIIKKPSQLLWFAQAVNGSDGVTPDAFQGKTVKLDCNIDLSGVTSWTPIGNPTNKFKGTFDGDNNSIMNLSIVEKEAKEGKAYIGFFGYAEGVTIQNVTFENVNLNIPCLDIDHSQGHIGAVAGSLEGTSIIENVTMKGDIKVEATFDANGASRVAVVAGGNSYGNVTMKNVRVDANEGSYLKANNNVGALAGQLQGKSVFENCSSNIDVTGKKFFAGGIIGLAAGNQTFTNCHTTGDVTIIAGREGNGNDHYRVGGIAGGWADGANNVCTLTNCSYSGKISGKNADGSVAEPLDYAGFVGRGYSLNNCTSKVVIDGDEYVQASNNVADAGIYVVNGAYDINTVAALKWLAKETNGGNTFFKKTVILTADLDLNNEEWTPIGNSTTSFQGTFDGQGHTISNLLLNMPGKTNVGLFGMTTNGEIKNLTVDNAKVTGRLNVGVVAGTPYTSKYTNIKVTGHVEVDGMSYVGGVGGKNAYANWTDVTVDVDATSYVKANSVENGTAYHTYVGGVIGFMGEGGHKVSNVTSNINVSGTTIDVGGIVGIAHYGNTFENVTCTGNVGITDAAEAADAEEMGGIAGVWNNGGANVTFTNCSFTGTLKSNIAEGVDLSDNIITGKSYDGEGTGKLNIDGKIFMVASSGDAITAATNAATSDLTIILYDDITNDATIVQKADVDIVIEGNNHNYKGTIYLEGQSRFKGAETLTIQNVNFSSDSAKDFISCDDANDGTKRYAHNVTVKDCTFTGSANGDVVGMRYRQCYNMTVVNCTATGMHSLMWATGGDGITIDDVEVKDSKNGVSFGTSNNIEVKNSAISTKGDYGYAIRVDANGTYMLNVDNSTLLAEAPILLRKATADYTLNLTGKNNLQTTKDYQIIVTASDYEAGKELTKATGKVKINGAEGMKVFGL